MDIKNRVKEIRRKYHYLGKIRMELAQDLWDDLMTHTAVLKRIGHSLYPTVTDDSTVIANAQNEDEDRLKAIFKKLVKVDEIVPRDSYALLINPVRIRTDSLILSLNKWKISRLPTLNSYR